MTSVPEFRSLRFFVLFLLLMTVFFTLEILSPVQEQLIRPFTAFVARLSALLVMIFDSGVMAQGEVLRDTDSGFAVAIQAGCNGVEAVLVFAAAVLAYPCRWREKIQGIAMGVATIQGFNLLRIISLFYLGQWNASAFQWFHLYGWQALIMLDVLLVFLLWLHFLVKNNNEMAEPAS